MKSFEVGQFAAWVGALIVAIAGTVSFAFTTFETKEHQKEIKADIVERLDRMENKIDQIKLQGEN